MKFISKEPDEFVAVGLQCEGGQLHMEELRMVGDFTTEPVDGALFKMVFHSLPQP